MNPLVSLKKLGKQPAALAGFNVTSRCWKEFRVLRPGGMEVCGETAQWRTKRKRFIPLHPWEIVERLDRRPRSGTLDLMRDG